MSAIFFLGIVSVSVWLYLAAAHGWFWQPLLIDAAPSPAVHPSVDIILPVRNEADYLPQTLPSLLAQDYTGEWKIILIDDHSTDDTANIARTIAANVGLEDKLAIITAPDVEADWNGKVAAMNMGVSQSQSDMIFFTEADIRHAPQALRHLVAEAEAKGLALVSRMVLLNCKCFAEQLLVPAFVFFFMMLYPFRQVNDPRWSTAAAAGGAMLVRRNILDKVGGLAGVKSATIEDCALAKTIKRIGGKIQLALTRDSESLRSHPHIKDICQLVARSAYTQLSLSKLFLFACIFFMILLFIAPPFFLIFSSTHLTALAGLIGLILIVILYGPIVGFYGLPWDWTFTLPLAALIYIAATVDSARLHYRSKGGQAKGRN